MCHSWYKNIPCMIFSKSMQNDEIDILGALTGLLKTLETDKLASKPLDQWSMYAATVSVLQKKMGAQFTKCRSSKGVLKLRATSLTTMRSIATILASALSQGSLGLIWS